MRKDEVSRRFVVGALGVGAASAAVGVAEHFGVTQRTAGDVPPTERSDAEQGSASESSDPALAQALRLISPLVVGARLGRWIVRDVVPVESGALSVVLADAEERRFQLDVCALDDAPDARRAPGRSEHFEVFLANNGNGGTSTFEDHGLAAMTLADLIRANEQHVERTAFQTLRQRVEANRVRLHIT